MCATAQCQEIEFLKKTYVVEVKILLRKWNFRCDSIKSCNLVQVNITKTLVEVEGVEWAASAHA